jgi:hypothetical protein
VFRVLTDDEPPENPGQSSKGMQRGLEAGRGRTDERGGYLQPGLELRVAGFEKRCRDHRYRCCAGRTDQDGVVRRDADRTVRGRSCLSCQDIVHMNSLDETKARHQHDEQQSCASLKQGGLELAQWLHNSRYTNSLPKLDDGKALKEA